MLIGLPTRRVKLRVSVCYQLRYVLFTPMDELLIEEMGKLTLGSQELTTMELASHGNETFVIIGTKSSKLVIMETKSQSAKIIQVSQLPIV